MKPHPVTTTKLSESELDDIRTLIEQRSAILFDASRERFFSTRIREYIEEKELAGGTELFELVKGSSIEYESLLERLLTQETSFFRYPAVYDALEKRILPEVQERKFWQNPRALRIWSAGCSTGEEAYSIAITLCDALKFVEAWEIEILATDISRRALRHAERGLYSKRSLQDVSLGKWTRIYEHQARLSNQAAHQKNDLVRANESGRAGLCRQAGLHLLHERAHVFFGIAPSRDSAPLLRRTRTGRLFSLGAFGDALQRAHEI